MLHSIKLTVTEEAEGMQFIKQLINFLSKQLH